MFILTLRKKFENMQLYKFGKKPDFLIDRYKIITN